MSKFEILCVTMHQNDFSKIKEMNIHSDVVFTNQCDHTSYEEIEFDGHTAKMISTQTRGVGKNRNLAITAALTNHSLSGRFLFENPHFPQVKSREKHPKNAPTA